MFEQFNNARRIRRAIASAATLALVLLAPASEAATSAGSLDPTFGTGGKKIVDLVPGGDDDLGYGAVQPDGKLVVSGYVARAGNPENGSIPVARFLDNGELDPSFGSGGMAIFAIDDHAYADWFPPAIGADGRIFVVGGARAGGVGRCVVLAVRPDGSLDPAFAAGGVFRYPQAAEEANGDQCVNIALQPDGKLVVIGNRNSHNINYVLRLTPAGTLDASFGNGGVAPIPGNTTNFVYGVAVHQPSGAIYLSGGPSTSQPGRIYKLTSTGTLDPGFGAGGLFTVPFGSSFLHSIAVLADGSAVASGLHGSNHLVLKVDASGTPVSSFGSGGFSEIALGTGYSAVSIQVQRDGKILIGIRHNTGTTWRFAVARLTANGLFDSTFATGGLATLDLGTAGEVLYGIALAPDGKVWVFGRADLSLTETAIALARLLPDEITTAIVEFHNTILDHYFVTADPNEAAAIDGGAAGPGWTRTGQTFASGGPNKAGRFYGNPDINPATGQRYGPNSHFYSLDPAEVAQVKLDIGWRFESYDFNAWPKAGAGCPAGTTGVMRVYNNRFPQNDSNHRYTIVQAIYDQMRALGWSGEGIVFCVVL